MRPDIKLKIIWVNTWFDPGKEADAAKALIDQGADIFDPAHRFAGADRDLGTARHSFFGEDTDMIRFGPHAQDSRRVTDYWGGCSTPNARRLSRRHVEIRGHLRAAARFGNGGDGALCQHAGRRKENGEMDTEADIKSGKLKVFKCPIKNQDGKAVECKGGDHLDIGQVRSMNWYVNGIDDKLPSH